MTLYTLTADTVLYVDTGRTETNVLVGHKLSPVCGVYVQTGQAAGDPLRRLSAAKGTYAYTGHIAKRAFTGTKASYAKEAEAQETAFGTVAKTTAIRWHRDHRW